MSIHGKDKRTGRKVTFYKVCYTKECGVSRIVSTGNSMSVVKPGLSNIQ